MHFMLLLHEELAVFVFLSFLGQVAMTKVMFPWQQSEKPSEKEHWIHWVAVLSTTLMYMFSKVVILQLEGEPLI